MKDLLKIIKKIPWNNIIKGLGALLILFGAILLIVCEVGIINGTHYPQYLITGSTIMGIGLIVFIIESFIPLINKKEK